jgi:recombination protein RecA
MKNYSLIDPSTPLALSPQAWRALAARDLTMKGARELTAPELPAAWRLSTFAGRFVEVSADQAGAALTLAFRLVLEAQKGGEPVAWVTGRVSTFFPPDAAESGIDLSALAVIRAPEAIGAARAAEHLLRSGSFGLVVLDLGAKARLPLHAQSRLAGQARQHATALLCLTEKERSQPSLGSLVSIRVHAARREREGDRYRCEAQVLKDKRRGPGWGHVEVCRGPDGLH